MSNDALDLVWATRSTIDELREALSAAHRDHAEALRLALLTHSRNEVAETAGMTPAGMYKALARVYGQRRPSPRRNPRPAGIDI